MDTYSMLEHAHAGSARLARVVALVTLGVVVAACTVVITILAAHGASKRTLAWAIASVMVILTVPLSSHDIRLHLYNFELPELQKFIVRILFMVPLYSVTCWMCLGDEDLYVYLEAIRSLYEAFVIWNFLYFLMGYLGPTEEMVVAYLEAKEQEQHIFPVNFMLRPWKMGHEFLFKCKLGTLQYVVWKVANAFIVLLASALGIYGDGLWRPDHVYVYVTNITNVSQMLAIYALVLFYHATYKDLAAINPLAKFICIKGVVFFSFWQGSFISALVYFDVIKSTPYFSADVYAKALQDFIICIEMFGFAVVHHFVFSYRDFKSYSMGSGIFSTIDSTGSGSSQASSARRPLVQAILEAANPRDLVHDISSSFRRVNTGASFGSAFEDEERASHDGGGGASRSAAVADLSLSDAQLLDADESDSGSDPGDEAFARREASLGSAADVQRSLRNAEVAARGAVL